MIFENRKLEIKENYNSYIEIKRRFAPRKGNRASGHEGENPRALDPMTLTHLSEAKIFLAKRIRAHDGCLGIGRL